MRTTNRANKAARHADASWVACAGVNTNHIACTEAGTTSRVFGIADAVSSRVRLTSRVRMGAHLEVPTMDAPRSNRGGCILDASSLENNQTPVLPSPTGGAWPVSIND